jgi:hypothetical protein
VPRRVKDLPDDRADYSFGDLVYWHLFIFGTRPDCDPSAKICRPWDPQTFCALVDISDRTLWNWVFDRHLPDNLLPVEAELFGHNPQLHDWRIELARALRAGRLQRTSEARFGVEPPAEAGEDDSQSAQSGIEDELPTEDAGDGEVRLPARYSVEEQEKHDGPVLDLPALRRERERAKDEHEGRGGPIDLVILQREYRRERAHASARPRTNRRRAVFGFLVPGLMLLLGMYGWVRPAPEPGQTQIVLAPPPPGPGVKPPPGGGEKKAPPPRALTEQEKRDAEERRLKEKTIDALKVASDAEKRAREQEAIRRDQEELAASRAYDDREFNRRQLAGMGYRLRPNTSASGTSIGVDVAESVNDCGLKCLSRGDCDGFAYYRDQKVSGAKAARSCYFFKWPIEWIGQPSYDGGEKISNRSAAPASENPEATPVRFELAQASPPQVEANGVVQCSGEPVKVTGFRILCDKLIVGGSALGSTQLRYSVSHINECAAKCRAVAQCGGFADKSMAYRDKHDCEIMGPTKNMNNGGGWISGVR